MHLPASRRQTLPEKLSEGSQEGGVTFLEKKNMSLTPLTAWRVKSLGLLRATQCRTG